MQRTPLRILLTALWHTVWAMQLWDIEVLWCRCVWRLRYSEYSRV